MSFSNSPKDPPKYFHFSEVASTQDEAARLLSEGVLPPFVVSADLQTKGRGRLGRSWITERDRSLAFTLCYRSNSTYVSGLSLVVGLAARKVIQHPELKLKWPNDLMLGDSKVGGILIESKSQGTTMDFLIGLGLNLQSLKTAQYIGIDRQLAPKDLADEILNNLVEFSRVGFSAFRSEFESWMWKRGAEVTYSIQNQKKKVKILGVNDEGGLRIDSGGKLSLHVDGEILHED